MVSSREGYADTTDLVAASRSEEHALTRLQSTAKQIRHTERRYLGTGASKRSFIIYRPSCSNEQSISSCSLELPLVLALHGSFSTASDMMHHTKLNRLAEKEQFLVVYPELGYRFALDLTEKQAEIERKLLIEMVKYLVSTEKVNARRVFATGFSSGADLLHYIATFRETASLFNAFAPVCFNMNNSWAESIDHDLPVSMLMVGGTDDKLNKWDGNPPKLASVPDSFEFWCRHNSAIPIEPNRLAFANDVVHFKHRGKDIEASTSMELSAAVNQSTGAEVVLAKVVGGGHTWPGAQQRNHLLRFICGPTHSLHSANEIIWSFFSKRS